MIVFVCVCNFRERPTAPYPAAPRRARRRNSRPVQVSCKFERSFPLKSAPMYVLLSLPAPAIANAFASLSVVVGLLYYSCHCLAVYCMSLAGDLMAGGDCGYPFHS